MISHGEEEAQQQHSTTPNRALLSRPRVGECDVRADGASHQAGGDGDTTDRGEPAEGGTGGKGNGSGKGRARAMGVIGGMFAVCLWVCVVNAGRRTSGQYGLVMSTTAGSAADNRLCWCLPDRGGDSGRNSDYNSSAVLKPGQNRSGITLDSKNYPGGMTDKCAMEMRKRRQYSGELCPDKKSFGLGYDKFLTFFVDGLAFDVATKFGITSGDNTHVYRAQTRMIQITSAVVTSYFVGVPQTNIVGNPIKTDNLLYQMNECDGKTKTVSFYAVKKHFDGLASLFPRNLVKEFRYSSVPDTIFGSVLSGSGDEIRARVDNMTNNGQVSVLISSEVLDLVNHRSKNGKYSSKASRLAKALYEELEEVKKWVQVHPEYLLIVMTDHGGTYHADVSSSVHGPELEGNEAFIYLYNPSLQLQPQSNSSAGVFPLLQVTDVASTLSQYLSCASIPMSSFGIPTPASDNAEFISTLYAQTCLQLLTNIEGSGLSVPKSVQDELMPRKTDVKYLGAIVKLLETLPHSESVQKFHDLARKLSEVIAEKHFPFFRFCFINIISFAASYILYLHKIPRSARIEYKLSLVFLLALSFWLSLILCGMAPLFWRNRQFDALIPFPSFLSGLIAISIALDSGNVPISMLRDSLICVLTCGWMLSYRLMVGQIVQDMIDANYFTAHSFTLFSILTFLCWQFVFAAGWKQKIYVLAHSVAISIVLYIESGLISSGMEELNMLIIFICIGLILLSQLHPIMFGDLNLWHLPVVAFTFILYQKKERDIFLVEQLPAFLAMRRLSQRNSSNQNSRLLPPLIVFLALSIGYSCHATLRRDYHFNAEVLAWPWLPFPTEVHKSLGGTLLIADKFASFLLAVACLGQGLQNPNEGATEATSNNQPTKNHPALDILFRSTVGSEVTLWITLYAHSLLSSATYEVAEFFWPERDVAFVNSEMLLICTLMLSLPLLRRFIITPTLRFIISFISTSLTSTKSLSHHNDYKLP